MTRGVWRDESAVADLAGRCSVMLAGLPPSCVISDATAARLHRFWLPGSLDERMDVTLCTAPGPARERAHSIRGEVRAHRRYLRADEIVLIGGVPVTSPTRTWIDLAGSLTPADLVAAGDSLLRGEQSADLDKALRRGTGRRHIRRARTVRPLLDARSRSRPESHLRFGLVSGGLPVPEVNQPISDRFGQWLAEPDLHFERAKLALEYNGADHATRDRMRRDITRELGMRDEGWHVIVFGPNEVFKRMAECVARVRRQLDLRDPGWWQRVAA